MKSLLLDKIGSVTRSCRLSREVRIDEEIDATQGSVLAVRVLTSKSSYNQLELVSGRFSSVKPGDVCAVALGHRQALFGYSGHVPSAVAVGDHLHMLNLGGVLGVCDSINPDYGNPFVCEVLGQVLHFPYLGERIGVPANITQGALPLGEELESRDVPVVMVVGSSMSSGKTGAACALVQAFTHAGYDVAAGKVTGVSLRRDILAMEDAGAKHTVIFTDFGVVTTEATSAKPLARSIVTHLAARGPDLIVLELGDGLLGPYGVSAILDDGLLCRCVGAVVLAASDPVSAWGGVRLLAERHDLPTTAVTGPATDNAAGVDVIEAQAGTKARNARTDARGLCELVSAALGLT